ncbi:MAG TPA: hypothetical protein VF192_16760 [Longimicrobiales bacterium]
MRTPLLVLLACATAACGADTPARSTRTAAVDTVNGVERLSYPADPATPLAWRFDTLAVIGGTMVADENYQFEGVSRDRLAGNAQGHLLVLDGQGKRILRYDSTGMFVRSYGREGGGPGELRLPISIALGPGDSLWVPDMMNRRITIFDAAGGGSRSISGADEHGLSVSNVRLGGGSYYRTGEMFMAGANADGQEVPPVPLVRYTPDGIPLDTVWRHQPPPITEVWFELAGRRVTVEMGPAFAPAFRWAPLSDGRVVVSDSANYVLHIIRPDGTIERTIRRDPPARATTDADREAARERERNLPAPRLPGMPADAQVFRSMRAENMTFAATIPRVTALLIDPKDRIWVGVSVDEPEKTERIDIYDAAGRLLGEIRDPAFFPDLLYGPDLAALLTKDEFDVQQVVVMRVVE